jgi:hypothetical protein
MNKFEIEDYKVNSIRGMTICTTVYQYKY